MQSPFPGMDPYLQQRWPGVHPLLVTHVLLLLNPRLGPDLRARIEERVLVERTDEPGRSIYPDGLVIARPSDGVPDFSSAQSAAAAVIEPLVMPNPNAMAKQRFIQVVDVTTGGEVITVIELLFPGNKRPGKAQDMYLQKQHDVIQAGINLVEIDLTRGGERQLGYPVEHLPTEYQTTYLSCVHRGFSKDQFEIYRMPLREKLPAIRIPLRDQDADVTLDLQHLVDATYQAGRYDDLDYRKPCEPPLEGEDAAWADQLLRQAGHR